VFCSRAPLLVFAGHSISSGASSSPGDYEVWVNAYGRDVVEDQYSESDGSGVVNYFTDTPFHVDVYLGCAPCRALPGAQRKSCQRRRESAPAAHAFRSGGVETSPVCARAGRRSSIGPTSLVATVSHATASNDKWFHAGTLTSSIAGGNACDSSNEKMQRFPFTDPNDPKATPTTIDVCYSWQTVGEIKAYPLGEAPARRALEAQVAKRRHAKGAHVRPSIASAVAAQRAQRGAKAAQAAKP
jgi:hypothetical protein